MKHSSGNVGIWLLVIVVIAASAGGGYVAYQDRYRKDKNFRWEVRKMQKSWTLQVAKLQEVWDNITGPIKLSQEEQDRIDAKHEEQLQMMAGSMNAAARRRSGPSAMGAGEEEVPGPKEIPPSHREDYQSDSDFKNVDSAGSGGY